MNYKAFINLVIVAVISLALVMPMVPNGESMSHDNEDTGTMAANTPEPDYVIGEDLIVSYDEPENYNDALHPSVATAPAGSPFDGMIYVVWDEFDDSSGYKEIHFSMSEDGGITWSNDHNDFLISENRKTRANSGDAVNPTIAVDHNGFIHVVWSEQLAVDGTWEVMYSRSEDNGKTWTGTDIGDTMISHHYGDRQDAFIMSTPEIKVGLVGGRATEILHVVWSEMDDKFTQEEIHYSRSFDYGNSWTGFEVDDYISKPDDHFASDPSIAISGGEANFIHVTWKQEGPNGFDEIWYSTSDAFGDRETWTEEKLVSAPLNDGMDVTDVSMCYSEIDGNLYTVWKQYPREQGKAPMSEIYYSFNDGGGWSGVEQDAFISFPDGYEPFSPKISFSDRVVQVVWTEIDDSSPRGTQEIHTSWSENPMDPESWTGLKGDIVLSNGDDWGPANANNVSFEYANLKGEWKPVFVWDELNDGPTETRGTGDSRAQQNTEIHTEPVVEWTLSTSVSGSGSISRNPSQSTYEDGEYVLLTANPSTGWSFDHWELDIGGSTNPYNLLMNDDKSVRAVFTQNQYTLSTSVSGSGSISKNPNQSTYTYGQVVTLTANPSAGWSFDHWSGSLTGSTNPTAITMTSNKAVTAWFTQDQYTLSVSVVGGGSVEKSPSQATYTYGQTVTLTANPSAGWEFDHWEGAISGTTNPDTVTMYTHNSVTCYFSQITYDISLYAGWNLVSIPLVQSDTTLTTVLSSISGQYSSVKYYDNSDASDPWKSYSPSNPSISDLSNIDHTMAFWIYADSSCTLTATGEYPTSTVINLYTGWNFVGYPTQDATKKISDALTGTSYDIVEGFDPDDQYLLRTVGDGETMMPGAGYWIHVPADTTWTVDW